MKVKCESGTMLAAGPEEQQQQCSSSTSVALQNGHEAQSGTV
jgi:hypothetical protein